VRCAASSTRRAADLATGTATAAVLGLRPAAAAPDEEEVPVTGRPVVLFACVHNSGRSLAAKVLAERLGGDRLAPA
jgi:hypothetical protein